MPLSDYQITVRKKQQSLADDQHKITIGPFELILFVGGILAFVAGTKIAVALGSALPSDFLVPLVSVPPAIFMGTATARIAKKKMQQICFYKLAKAYK